MSFSTSQMKQKLQAMSPQEREKTETQMLADYARNAALGRPLNNVGFSRLFRVMAGMEETSLSEDNDIISVTNSDELEQAIQEKGKPMILVRSNAAISEELVMYMLGRSLNEKTIFMAK